MILIPELSFFNESNDAHVEYINIFQNRNFQKLMMPMLNKRNEHVNTY